MRRSVGQKETAMPGGRIRTDDPNRETATVARPELETTTLREAATRAIPQTTRKNLLPGLHRGRCTISILPEHSAQSPSEGGRGSFPLPRATPAEAIKQWKGSSATLAPAEEKILRHCYPSLMVARVRFLELIEAMQGRTIAVYGDLVADRFIYGVPKRISREAPVLILRQYRDDILPGGAGNAILNVAALGGRAIPVGIVGQDAEGDALLARLEKEGIDASGILRLERTRTPTKTRVLGGMPHAARQQIVRFDLDEEVALEPGEHERFAGLLHQLGGLVDAGLISDYGYGAVTSRLVETLLSAAGRKPVVLDSRYDLLRYPGVTAATPNEEEAAIAAGTELLGEPDEEEKIEQVGLSLREALDSDALLITRGSQGMALFERGRDRSLRLEVWGGDQVADVTGAGDTVIATFTLALSAGASFAEAAALANYAGGIVVMKMGTAVVSAHELRDAVSKDERL